MTEVTPFHARDRVSTITRQFSCYQYFEQTFIPTTSTGTITVEYQMLLRQWFPCKPLQSFVNQQC